MLEDHLFETNSKQRISYFWVSNETNMPRERGSSKNNFVTICNQSERRTTPLCKGLVIRLLSRAGCWLSVEGVPDAVRLTAGDCFLLPRGLASCLASDLTLTPVDAETVFPFPLNGVIASCNGGGECLLVGGNFVLSGKPANILMAELPPIVHIRTRDSIAEIALSLGYETSSAFTKAFKKAMGCSPRQYGRTQNLNSPA
jgi:AraC-like DNA-binding protein